MLNRSAILLIKKQPFLDWLKKLPDPVGDEMTLTELNEEATVYLLPEWEDASELDQLIRAACTELFEQELHGWWNDAQAWPKARSFREFQRWFDVQAHSVLVDLVDGPLHDDDA